MRRKVSALLISMTSGLLPSNCRCWLPQAETGVLRCVLLNCTSARYPELSMKQTTR
jgi:hypothetical protein